MEIAAPNLESLYADATDLVRELVVGQSEVAASDVRQVAVAGADGAETFLAFLRELLFVFETEGFVPARFEAERTDERGVRGRLHGERFDPARHEAQPEVKAVTRHGLALERADAGWRAQVVFDV